MHGHARSPCAAHKALGCRGQNRAADGAIGPGHVMQHWRHEFRHAQPRAIKQEDIKIARRHMGAPPPIDLQNRLGGLGRLGAIGTVDQVKLAKGWPLRAPKFSIKPRHIHQPRIKRTLDAAQMAVTDDTQGFL